MEPRPHLGLDSAPPSCLTVAFGESVCLSLHPCTWVQLPSTLLFALLVWLLWGQRA